jgi:hypothetical protein
MNLSIALELGGVALAAISVLGFSKFVERKVETAYLGAIELVKRVENDKNFMLKPFVYAFAAQIASIVFIILVVSLSYAFGINPGNFMPHALIPLGLTTALMALCSFVRYGMPFVVFVLFLVVSVLRLSPEGVLATLGLLIALGGVLLRFV